jgi:hypothetical protein
MGTRVKKWIVIAMGLSLVISCAFDIRESLKEKETITYVVEVDYNDTIYDIATRIATPKENINYLSWKIQQDNHIKDPGALRPGTKLVVNVERVKD